MHLREANVTGAGRRPDGPWAIDNGEFEAQGDTLPAGTQTVAHRDMGDLTTVTVLADAVSRSTADVDGANAF